MRSLLLVIVLALFSGCSVIRPSWIDENSYVVDSAEQPDGDDSILGEDIGPLGGHFDDDGKWIPDDPDIEMTYKIPDISSGFMFDIATLSVSPTVQIELFEIDTHIPYLRRIKLDAGVAYQRGFIYVGKLWTSIFEISTGGFFGWNWEENKPSYGISFTIFRF